MENKKMYHYTNILYENTDDLRPDKIFQANIKNSHRSTEVSWSWASHNIEKTRNDLVHILKPKDPCNSVDN